VLGEIAKGVLSKVGGDAYQQVKAKLKDWFGKPANAPEFQTRLLDLSLVVERGDKKAEVHAVLENPSAESIENLFDRGMEGIERVALAAFEEEPRTARIVVDWREDEPELRYAMRDDGALTIESDEGKAARLSRSHKHWSVGGNATARQPSPKKRSAGKQGKGKSK